MNISLEDLYNKKVKPSEGMTVSDNKVDLSKFTGSEVIFTGRYPKGIYLIVRPQIEVAFKNAEIDNGGTNVTLKIDGAYDQFKLTGINAKFFGKAGNAASQMIYFNGTWSNIMVGGFELDQRRNGNPGNTTTGPNLQFAGVFKAGHNLGKVYVYDMIYRNSGDESDYDNYNNGSTGAARGEELLVENCKSYNSGRDVFQQWGFKNVTYKNCYGENAGLEAESNHCSALSMNGGTEVLLVENCEFKNMAQLIYSNYDGKQIKATFNNVKYTQGTHAGARNNQAAYLKGPGEYTFKNCVIDAPSVKEAAITADGCKVIVESSCKITAPKLSRTFNGGSVIQTNPDPVVVTTHGDLIIETTTTWEGLISVKYFALMGDVKTELIVK